MYDEGAYISIVADFEAWPACSVEGDIKSDEQNDEGSEVESDEKNDVKSDDESDLENPVDMNEL